MREKEVDSSGYLECSNKLFSPSGKKMLFFFSVSEKATDFWTAFWLSERVLPDDGNGQQLTNLVVVVVVELTCPGLYYLLPS